MQTYKLIPFSALVLSRVCEKKENMQKIKLFWRFIIEHNLSLELTKWTIKCLCSQIKGKTGSVSGEDKGWSCYISPGRRRGYSQSNPHLGLASLPPDQSELSDFRYFYKIVTISSESFPKLFLGLPTPFVENFKTLLLKRKTSKIYACNERLFNANIINCELDF